MSHKGRCPDFTDLVETGEWQEFQDALSRALGLGIRCLGPKGDRLSEPSNMPLLKICGDCGVSVRGASPADHPEGDFHCHVGLYNLVRPILLTGRLAPAYAVLGPIVAAPRPTGEALESAAAELRTEARELEGLLRELPALSYGRAKALADSVAEVLTLHLMVSSERGNLSGRIVKMFEEKAPLDVFSRCRDTHDLAEALVETCFKMLRPTRASVLIREEESGDLVLRACRGISEEVAKTARVRMGEGIAGLAAQRRERFFISSEVNDSEIRERMSNPDLAHSIVTPIDSPQGVFAVFCVSRDEEAAPFDSSELAFLDRMVEQAEEALSLLPLA